MGSPRSSRRNSYNSCFKMALQLHHLQAWARTCLDSPYDTVLVAYRVSVGPIQGELQGSSKKVTQIFLGEERF